MNISPPKVAYHPYSTSQIGILCGLFLEIPDYEYPAGDTFNFWCDNNDFRIVFPYELDNRKRTDKPNDRGLYLRINGGIYNGVGAEKTEIGRYFMIRNYLQTKEGIGRWTPFTIEYLHNFGLLAFRPELLRYTYDGVYGAPNIRLSRINGVKLGKFIGASGDDTRRKPPRGYAFFKPDPNPKQSK